MIVGIGRYNLLLKLGQGGMGAVYLARQKNLRRYCAVKLITPQLSQDQSAAERFLREARSTASLSHPNLVSVFDCDQFEGQYFIAMEYIEGKSLGQILRKTGALPLPLAFYWLHQAAVGLQYLHEKEIVHRDIKPDNMIVDSTGNLKLMDLGLAKDHFEGDQGMTMTGMVMGSPHYMSPEQIHDSKTVDIRTDIYSLGIAFYQMVVGTVPFMQTSAAAVCVAHLQDPIPSVQLPDSDLTFSLDGLIAKMAAKNREERFQSCSELLEILGPWLENYPLDDSSTRLFGSLGFEENKVSNLLQKEGIQEQEVDRDLNPMTPMGDLNKEKGATPSGESDGVPGFRIWVTSGSIMILILAVILFAAIKSRKRQNQHAEKPSVVQQPTNTAPIHSGVVVEEKKESPPLAEVKPPPPPSPSASESRPALVPSFGSLSMDVVPDSAVVTITSNNFSQATKAPFVIEQIPPGKYKLNVAARGYKEENREIEIQAGKVNHLQTFKLVQIVGTLKLETVPSEAEVFLNGKFLDKTPCEVRGVAGESVNLMVRLEGYFDEPLRAPLTQNGEVQKIVLRPMPRPTQPPRGEFGDRFNRRFDNRRIEDRGMDMPMNPVSETDAMTRVFSQMLDSARNIPSFPSSKWDAAKKKNLDFIEKRLNEKNSKDSLGIKKALLNISSTLDRARSLSVSDYSKQKNKLVQSMVDECGKIIPSE